MSLSGASQSSSTSAERSAAATIQSAASIRRQLKLTAPPGQDMPQPDFLLALHAVTCGKQGPEAGTDETPICQLAYLVYDVQRQRVVLAQQLPVKPLFASGRAASPTECPTREDGRAPVSEECARETGITEDSLDSAASLVECLAGLDRALRQADVHPEAGGRSLRLVTDGQAPLRLMLHPEAAAKQLELPDYCCSFHDLRKEFARAYGRDSPATLSGMLSFLGLESADLRQHQPAGHGVMHCLAMSRVIGYLLADGHMLHEPENICTTFSPAVVRQSDPVDPETVARARGLPWQAGDAEVAAFFCGLNIRPGGVALVLSRTGRRNGEALVRFESPEQRDLALLRHRHHLGQRYIEVFKASARDFLAAAAAASPEAEAFLARLQKPSQQLVRMRGLPYTVTLDQVLDFFNKSACPVQFGQSGLLFAQRSDGRASGDAFVLFGSAELAERALLRGHRQHIGSRYVELFKSTPAELNQVLNSYQRRQIPSVPALSTAVGASVADGSRRFGQPHLIRIRGMPAEATVADILGFLEQHAVGIAFQGVHQVLNHLGQPTGEAIIEMLSERAVQLTCEAKDGRQFCLSGGIGPAAAVDVQRCLPQPPPLLPATQAQFLPLGHGNTRLLHHSQFPAVLALQSPFVSVPIAPLFTQPISVASTALQISQYSTDGLLAATQAVLAI